MDKAFTVLPFEQSHAKAIAALEQQIFADEPWSESALMEEAENRFTKSFVVLDGDTYIGYLLGSCVCGDAALNRIAILPAYRGNGIADALMEQFLDALRTDDAVQCALEVRQSNTAAIRLYEKYGFCAVGVRKQFYKHPTEDAILMVKPFENQRRKA